MNFSPERQHGESQSAYRMRRMVISRRRRSQLRGRPVWISCRLVDGAEMYLRWRETNKYPTNAEVAAARKKFGRDLFFKVGIQGTYRRAEAGPIAYEPVYGRKRILPSNRPRAITARATK